MSFIIDGSINTITNANGLTFTGPLTLSNNLTVNGNLLVNGTTTTVNATTLDIKDINVTLGKVTSPTDTTAIGGGITLLGSTNKTITWNNATAGWEFNQPVTVTGALSATGLTYYSTNIAVSAAGTTQGTATAIAVQKNIVTTCASGAGVILMTPTSTGAEIFIDNDSANALIIYPQSGATIDGGAANAPITIPVGAVVALLAKSTTAWDAGISVNPVYSTLSVTGSISAATLVGVTIDTTTNKPVTAASLNGGTLPASVTTLTSTGAILENSKVVDATGSLTVFTVVTQYVYLTGTAGASFAITLPAVGAGIDGQKCIIMSRNTRTSTTWASSGGTVLGAPTTLTADTPVCLHYDHASLSWYMSL